MKTFEVLLVHVYAWVSTSEPTQNTHSESTEWGEIRFRKNDMKYRYDWAEIKHVSDLWCYKLSRMDEVFQGHNPVIACFQAVT